ncbi:glycoside hydrolase family 9 protein [Streptomyces sp. MAR4 CNX-425]|uniref:glycoside hydrolase family 9 protein n=1 Tax=Streptomyces sp. MAR4 CNX-425 TaxID=3406343 RepID=UPI003B506CB6
MRRHIPRALAAVLVAGALAAPGGAAAAADEGPELIVNGDFAAGTDPWWWTPDNPATVVDGRLCAEVPAGTANPWDAIVGQNDLPIEAGETYALRYTATATTPVTIRTNVQQAVEPWAQFFASADQVTDTAQTFEHIFTATAGDEAAQLAFQIGGSDTAYTFCVDDVSLRGGAERPPYDPDTGSPVRVNQVGYLTEGPKNGTFVTDATEPLTWTLNAADGTEKASGTTVPAGTDPTSLENVHTFAFGDFTEAGEGYTVTIDGQTSEPFTIGDDIYGTLRTDALAYFYHNRSGIEIDADLVGEEYARPAGHVNVAPNQGDDDVPCQPGVCDYTLDAAGGWYDAGDHGKYVVNGGIAAAQVMSVYERTLTTEGADGEPIGDGKLAVPEQGNGVPDVLDEARWQLEFLMSMQVPAGEELAGMAHHKLHDEQWTGLPLLPHEDPQPRELHPASTAATLNLAATGAQCARLYADFDAEFADRCLSAARTAYTAAEAHPDMLADPNDGTGGGAYSDSNVSDEFYWAAAELYLATGEDAYLQDVLGSPLHGDAEAVFPRGGMSWGATAGLGALDLATVDSGLTDAQLGVVRGMVTDAADGYAADAANAAYGVPYAPDGGRYVWGSNSQVLNNMVVLATAHGLTGESGYRDAVLTGLDYLLGRNPLNQSYVTGYGERDSKNQHHRFWANQLDPSLPNPAPGSIAGGPDSQLEDPVAEQELQGCPPAMCYIDHIESYSTNEITINWNAPLAWIAGYADDLGAADGGTGPGPGPGEECAAAYSVPNEWPGGFTGSVTLSCDGASLDGWTVEWDFPDGQRMTNAWNAVCTQSGTTVSCRNTPYNGAVPDGGSVSFGFNAGWSGANGAPEEVKLVG